MELEAKLDNYVANETWQVAKGQSVAPLDMDNPSKPFSLPMAAAQVVRQSSQSLPCLFLFSWIFRIILQEPNSPKIPGKRRQVLEKGSARIRIIGNHPREAINPAFKPASKPAHQPATCPSSIDGNPSMDKMILPWGV